NGMLSGIGVLIVASQFHVMLDDKPKGSGSSNLLSIPRALWDCLQQTEIGSTHVAGCVGLLTIVILVIWESGVPARWKVIPGALVAVAVGTAVTLAFHLDIKTITLPDNLLSTIRLPTTAVLPRLLDWQILLEAIGIAVVASAETLLSAG